MMPSVFSELLMLSWGHFSSQVLFIGKHSLNVISTRARLETHCLQTRHIFFHTRVLPFFSLFRYFSTTLTQTSPFDHAAFTNAALRSMQQRILKGKHKPSHADAQRCLEA